MPRDRPIRPPDSARHRLLHRLPHHGFDERAQDASCDSAGEFVVEVDVDHCRSVVAVRESPASLDVEACNGGEHDDSALFQGLSNPFEATRYHSLIVREETLPSELVVTAWTSDGEIMGLRHKSMAMVGVQFHPESILTLEGRRLLLNFLA